MCDVVDLAQARAAHEALAQMTDEDRGALGAVADAEDVFKTAIGSIMRAIDGVESVFESERAFHPDFKKISALLCATMLVATKNASTPLDDAWLEPYLQKQAEVIAIVRADHHALDHLLDAF